MKKLMPKVITWIVWSQARTSPCAGGWDCKTKREADKLKTELEKNYHKEGTKVWIEQRITELNPISKPLNRIQ